MKINGNKILISGGSTGIGMAMAKLFINEGNQVISIDRNPENQKKAKTKLPDLITYPCDVSNFEEVAELIEWLKAHHPDTNILINNAAIQQNYLFDGSPVLTNKICEEININLTAPLVMTNAMLPILKLQTSSAIVNITSALAIVPKKSAPTYCATKAGLHIYTRALRYQLENSNISVIEVMPPLVESKMTAGRGDSKVEPEKVAIALRNALKRDDEKVYIGKVNILRFLLRIWPAMAYKILKGS